MEYHFTLTQVCYLSPLIPVVRLWRAATTSKTEERASYKLWCHPRSQRRGAEVLDSCIQGLCIHPNPRGWVSLDGMVLWALPYLPCVNLCQWRPVEDQGHRSSREEGALQGQPLRFSDVTSLGGSALVTVSHGPLRGKEHEDRDRVWAPPALAPAPQWKSLLAAVL